MVAEYATKAYGPASASWQALIAEGLGAAREQARWLERTRSAWAAVRILDVFHELNEGDAIRVALKVHSGSVPVSDLNVEAIYGSAAQDGSLRAVGTVRLSPTGASEGGDFTFEGLVPLRGSGRQGYTIRLTPTAPNLHDPLTTGLIHWA
jgi:hypothetical protein